MKIFKAFLGVTVGYAIFMAAPPRTFAIPTLSLNDGMGHIGSISNSSGVVTFNGALGNFTMNITTGVTQPAPGSGAMPLMSLTSVQVTGTPGGTLTMMFSDIFSGSFVGTFGSHLEGTITPNGSIAYSTYADPGNTLFGMGTQLTGQGAFTSATYSGDANSALALSSFSLTQMVVITLDNNGVASFSAMLGGISGPAPIGVPEAGNSLLLLGLGGLALELLRRKIFRPFANAA